MKKIEKASLMKNGSIDRRSFLKRTSIAAASVSLLPVFGQAEMKPSSSHSSTTDTVTPKPAQHSILPGEGLIRQDGDSLILDTQAGALLKMKTTAPFGIGQFYFKGKSFGEEVPYFFRQETFDFIYRVQSFVITQNEENEASVTFKGQDQHFQFTVIIKVCRNAPSFYFNYHITKVLNAVTNLCYVGLPFDNQRPGFIQKPFNGPVQNNFQGQYCLIPNLVTVPLLYGKSGDENQVFAGIGYHLDTEEIKKGRLEYNSHAPHPLKVYFPFNYFHKPWGGKVRGEKEASAEYDLKFVYTLGETQTQMIKGYEKHSGYSNDTKIYRDTKTAMSGVHKCYKNIKKGYSDGKGYLMKIDPANGDIIGYGKFACPSYGPHISYLLYDYWSKNKQETWARERAIEMVNYYMDNQSETGAVPQLYDTVKSEFAGFGDYYTLKGFPFNICHFSIGTYGLLRFADLVEKTEKKNVTKYRQSAFKSVDYIAKRIEKDGRLGRSYSTDDQYDKVTAEAWALILLDHASSYPGKEYLNEKRDLLEKFTVDTFVQPNIWKDWSSDSVWKGAGKMPPNWDNMSALAFTSYCMRRHLRSGEKKYIDLAEHSFWYSWLASIPVNFPEYTNITKGLSKEQDVNELFDVPIRTCNLVDGLPYLSEITQNPFYVQYFRMMLQSYYYYQAIDTEYPAFWEALRVSSKELGGQPRDEIQPDGLCIVEWTCMFWESAISNLWKDSVNIEGKIYTVDK
jgi:hypothetical protein